jgi:hypothetical protein
MSDELFSMARRWRRYDRFPQIFFQIVHSSSLSIRHAEFSSASHREPLLVLLRGQILKFAVKREQRQACLNYAEREQIEQC